MYGKRSALGEARQLRLTGNQVLLMRNGKPQLNDMMKHGGATATILLPEVPDTSLFHILISGACLVEHKGYTQRLLPGDFMFVPRGAGEVLKSDPEAPVKALFDYPYTAINGSYEVLKWGDTGPVTRLLCGVVRLEDPSAHYLLKALPEILHLPHACSNHPQWLSQTVEIIMQEAEHPQLGGEALLTRLADVLVIQGIRHWVQEHAQARAGCWLWKTIALATPYS